MEAAGVQPSVEGRAQQQPKGGGKCGGATGGGDAGNKDYFLGLVDG
jgi:hypothetical protein